MKEAQKIIVFCSCLIVAFIFTTVGWAENHWFISLYGGRFSDNALLDILRFQTEFKDSHVCVLSIGKELGRYKNKLAYELEGQIALHNGMQSHEEFNGVFTLRWMDLPWDALTDTSVALGNGISYATTDPPLEKTDDKNEKASQWLYYLYVELAFRPFKTSEWDMFVRVHHRSGVFGLINDINSGSNFIGLGIRYQFGK